MARNKTTKMTICFEKSDLIKGLVGDIADEENRALSCIIERTVLKALLPENKVASEIVCKELYGENGNINNAISKIFTLNLSYNCKYKNLLPVVQFTYDTFQKELKNSEVKTFSDEIYSYNCLLEILSHKIENFNEEHILNLEDVFFLILENWYALNDSPYLYKVLYEVINSLKVEKNDPYLRLRLKEIITDLSKEWF